MKRGYHNFTPYPPRLPGQVEALPRIEPPLSGQRGAWECPRCCRINAWWKSSCSCKPSTDVSRLNGGNKPYVSGL